MTKLSKNHPFIIKASELEKLEMRVGFTDEIIKKRKELQEEFPEYFKEYMRAKSNRQGEKLQNEKIEKETQMRERGCETVSYHKMRKMEQKRRLSASN